MNASARSRLTWLLLLALTACAPAPTATGQLMPADLAFSVPLVESLNRSGINVLSVRSSVYMSMFQSTDKAAWIETNQGIADVVFFDDSTEAGQIRVSQLPGETAYRYLYKIQAPAPTLDHEVTLDAAFPLYFTMRSDMFIVTSSTKLDQTFKRILSTP